MRNSLSDRLLTIRETAELLSLSERTVYELARRDALPVVRLGGSLRIPRAALDAHLEKQLAKPAA